MQKIERGLVQDMSTEKTTTLSIVVGVAALLAELIFRNTLSSSTIGVILSVVLAAVILCCTYFVVDGIQSSVSSARKKEENRKREYDEKLYRLLNKRLSEIVKLQKEAMGESVLRDVNEDGQEISEENSQELFADLLNTSAEEADPVMRNASTARVQEKLMTIDNSERDRLLESINENIMKSAKFIVKYSKKNQEQTQQLTEKSVDDLLQAVKLVEKEIQSLGGQLSNLPVSSSTVSDDRISQLFAGGMLTEESILPKENELSDLFNTEEPEVSEEEPEIPIELEISGLEPEISTEPEMPAMVPEEPDNLSGLEEDIAADLLSARQEIQGEESETRLEDILPADILRELETVSIPEEETVKDSDEIVSEENPMDSNDMLKEIFGEVEQLIAEESEQISSEIEIPLDLTMEAEAAVETEAVESQEKDELTDSEVLEFVQELIESEEAKEKEAPEEVQESPVESLTAVDLLRIKQKEKEEEEARKEQEKQEEAEQEDSAQEELEQEENSISEKVEVPVQDDSNGIMSAEDIAALFASNNTES